MIAGIIVLIVVATACGALLAWCETRRTLNDNRMAEAIDRLLPQTQCTLCGYSGCRPYAEALAQRGTDINRCVPGGTVVIARLSELLGAPPLPPLQKRPEAERVARIDEAECIGCTLCLKACPVDAILGASKLMHTVIEELCTGCELCIAPCPVDCISLHAAPIFSPRRATAEILA